MSEQSRREEEKHELELMQDKDERDAQRQRYDEAWEAWHDYERQRSQGDGK